MITKHDKPNWDQCCSCCPILEKENKELKEQLQFIQNETNNKE